MRFTPSSKYNLYARAAVKSFSYAVFMKKTTALDEALTAGTWVEVPARLRSIPACSSRIEYELGQYYVDNIELEGWDIAWWDANVFNATSSQYIEVKVLFTLGQGSDVCTDTVYTFAGLVDKVGVQR